MPVSLAAETPGIVVASEKFPPNSLKEMIAYAKANPGKINYAAAGVSTLNTLAMEQFRHRLGLQMTQVPYKGGAGPAVVDLLAGNVDVMFVTLSSAAQFVKAGKLKGFAVTRKERVATLPDVPTVVELGFPEDVSGSWQGLFAVKGTPAPIVAKLHAAVLKAMADPGRAPAHDRRQHGADVEPDAGKLQGIRRRRIDEVERGGGTDQRRRQRQNQPLTAGLAWADLNLPRGRSDQCASLL